MEVLLKIIGVDGAPRTEVVKPGVASTMGRLTLHFLSGCVLGLSPGES